MKYPYIVNYNGVWYPTGAEVPVGVSDAPKIEENIVADAHKYTKTEIQKLTTAELKDLAKKEGIESASEISGNQLKKILVEHFGL